ncbi:MAG: tetratricopeptide repeat protein, partial [Myxococcota bacterium]|nr:tetratricopeptide repeat protein [Myxococcota bacterium]
EELAVTAPVPFIEKEEVEVERLVLDIATAYHNEYKTTREEKTLELTQLLYDEYLRLFRDKPNAYAISYNNALLMYLTGRFEAAAEEFERVIAMKPDGQYADDAGERAVIAYLKTLQVQNQAVKNEAEEDLKKRELEPSERKFVAAVDRWMTIVDRKGPNKETEDNIPPARFAAAKVLYDANHFDEAAKRFATFYRRHRDNMLWEDAARHVLSSYNLSHDVDNLRRYANLYLKDGRLMETALANDVHRIRAEFDFLECFKFEKKKAFLGAAQCFIDYQMEYPNAEKAPAAIFNAGLNYFKAKQVEKALEMQQRLYEQYSTHELAPKALYSIAEIFRETAVYEKSAEVYEVFVASYPNHPLAEKALRFASIFRKTLAQYKDAVANLELYLKRYPDPAKSPRVHLDVVLIREKQKSPNPILRAVRDHIKRYKTEPGGIRLRVLLAQGRAFKRLGKDKKAREAFQETVAYFRTLEDDAVRALQLPAISAVAESHFNLGEGLLSRARWIKLKGNEKKMAKAIKQKLTLMTEAKKVYEQVISYGHPGWMIAAYSQLGLAYRDLANAVEKTQVPKKIRRIPDAVEEFKTLMAEKAKPIRDKAIGNYAKALSIAREHHWFNKYSQRAENAIAQLDLTDRSIKESRIKPDRVRANSGIPDFKREVK